MIKMPENPCLKCEVLPEVCHGVCFENTKWDAQRETLKAVVEWLESHMMLNSEYLIPMKELDELRRLAGL